jgi:hypothetical protein
MAGPIVGPQTPMALVLGILFSGVFALGVLVAHRSRHVYLPYGPGLCLGGLLAALLAPPRARRRTGPACMRDPFFV